MNSTTDATELDSVFLNLGNCGIRFAVQDGKHGPTINIRHSAFGNQIATLEIMTNVVSLRALAELFLKASNHTFKNKDYCYLARVSRDELKRRVTMNEASATVSATAEPFVFDFEQFKNMLKNTDDAPVRAGEEPIVFNPIERFANNVLSVGLFVIYGERPSINILVSEDKPDTAVVSFANQTHHLKTSHPSDTSYEDVVVRFLVYVLKHIDTLE